MTMPQHISQDDLYLFALQFLPEPEAAVAHDHLQECDDCRRQLAWIQGDLVAYSMTADAQPVPEGARERLLRRIAKEKKVLPIARHYNELPAENTNVVPFRPRRTGFFGWAGWAVAAGLAVAVGLEHQQRRQAEVNLAESSAQLDALSQSAAQAQTALATLTASGAKRVSLHFVPAAATPPVPHGQASYSAEKGALVFVAGNLQPLAEKTVYELWVLPADKSAPIPAGTFTPDAAGNASVVMPPLPKGVAAGGFGVTVEKAGGTTTPTMSTLTLVGE